MHEILLNPCILMIHSKPLWLVSGEAFLHLWICLGASSSHHLLHHPFALPKWTWRGFQNRTLFESLSLENSTNFILLLPWVTSPKESSLCHLAPQCSLLLVLCPILSAMLSGHLFDRQTSSIVSIGFDWNLVLSLGHHLLCSPFKWRFSLKCFQTNTSCPFR